MLFDFLKDIGNYEERKVERYEGDYKGEDVSISTARSSDGFKSFETAVSHPNYKGGKWIIVESYDEIEEARAGHQRWVSVMTAKTLPTLLTDCINCPAAELGVALGGVIHYESSLE